MKKLELLIVSLREDVNDENSVIIGFFGRTVDFLYRILILAGIPFVFYILLQFSEKL